MLCVNRFALSQSLVSINGPQSPPGLARHTNRQQTGSCDLCRDSTLNTWPNQKIEGLFI